jgi:hypothetical protein
VAIKNDKIVAVGDRQTGYARHDQRAYLWLWASRELRRRDLSAKLQELFS